MHPVWWVMLLKYLEEKTDAQRGDRHFHVNLQITHLNVFCRQTLYKAHVAVELCGTHKAGMAAVCRDQTRDI